MPTTTYQYAVDFANTQFATDLICRGLCAQDEPANYDIAGYVQQATITRGRDREVGAAGQQPFQSGRLSLLLANSDFRFSPDNETTSPYANWDVGLMVQVRAYAMALGGLVSWWDFDTVNADSYGANRLTNNNGVTTTGGLINLAANFDFFSSSFLSVNSNSTLQMGANVDCTISVWVSSNFAFGAEVYLSKWNAAGNQREYAIGYDNAASRFYFQVSSNGTNTTTLNASSFGAPSAGSYYLIIAWYDGTNIYIQVNNGAIDSVAFTADIFAGSAPLLFGATGTVASPLTFFLGTLDSSFISKRVLTVDERTNLYYGGGGVGYYSIFANGVQTWRGIYQNLFTGFIDTIVPQPDDEQQTVTVECTDLMANMALINSVYSGMWQSLGTGALIKRLLSDGMAWRLDWTAIDTGSDTVTYAWWAAANLLQAIQSIERSEYGQFFIDGNGYPTFHARSYRLTQSITSGTAIGDASVQSLELRREKGEVYNFIQVQAHPRVVYKSGVQVWSSRQAILLTAGQTLALIAAFSDPNTQKAVPALNIIPPLATTDYSANDLINGGQVTAIAVNAAGSNYDVANPPTVNIRTDGGGYGATATATVATGSVSSVVITASGSGYTSAPTVAFSGGGGTGATGLVGFNAASGAVTYVTITNGGTGYTSGPSVAFSGGGGTGATATAYADVKGRIVAYVVTNGGGGYTTAPTVDVVGSGSGATATATVTVGTDRTSSLTATTNFKNYGQSATITITNTSGGSIYVPYLRLRGDPLMEPDTTPAFAQSGLSQSKYLLRAMLLDQPWQQSTVNAQSLAQSLILRYSTPQTRFTPHIANLSWGDLYIILNMELDDDVDGTFARAGIFSAKKFFAGNLTHTISDYGLLHQLAIGLEASRVENAGVWDTSVYDLAKFT